MQTFRYGIAPYAVLLIVLAALVGMEPHLSGAILIMGAGAVMMLVGGIHWRLGAAALWAQPDCCCIWCCSSSATTPPASTYWLQPLGWIPREPVTSCRQSLITIGSGGLWGVGLGKSRQKFLYLPEEHNDFIFAIVCEELGLIGATVIMLLFAALILRGFWIALHARDRFGSLMVVGVITLVGLADLFEHRRGDGPAAHHRHLPAVFQLWRHGAVHPAGGDGHCPVGIPADEAYKGGVVRPR